MTVWKWVFVWWQWHADGHPDQHQIEVEDWWQDEGCGG